MNLKFLEQTDPETARLIREELERQRNGLEMIPSENFASLAVITTMGTVPTNKYSEGYPNKRYYGGNEVIDKIESLAQERAKKLFDVEHVNVQPYSGSPANFAVYVATCKPGETVMGQDLTHGGHLTHGWKSSATGQFFKSVQYHVKPDGYIDIDEARRIAHEHKPKLIWVGCTAYTREFPFEEFAKIADEVGAYLVADIAHIAGLVLAGVHKSPAPYVHLITTTTHKTLRGPRGAMIMVTHKGLQKDPELADKIDKAVFPGLQGGPHDHITAAIAVALAEAAKPEFKHYGEQIVKNARALAEGLKQNGLKVVTGGTDNHMVLVDLTPFGKGKGVFVQEALNTAGITLNKNTIPGEPSSPFYPSGIRLGTPALTSRGMKEEQMKIIAGMIARVVETVTHYELPENKEERTKLIESFKKEIVHNSVVKSVRAEVLELCKHFPLYPELGN
jgi:glycine hydroxymethyltransferase